MYFFVYFFRAGLSAESLVEGTRFGFVCVRFRILAQVVVSFTTGDVGKGIVRACRRSAIMGHF